MKLLRRLLPTLTVLTVPASLAAQDAAGGPPGYQRGFVVLLKPGPQLGVMPAAEMQQTFMRHGAQLTALMQRGDAVVAGPFLQPAADAGGAMGFIVLRAATEQDARRIVDADPAVVARLFSYSLIASWLPPAGAPPR